MDLGKTLDLKDNEALFVLSPHLDDAIWSLGGPLSELAAQGHEVIIITIFSQTTRTAVRKAEDTGAIKEAGCEFRHLNFSDAILDGRPLEAVFDDRFVPADETVGQLAGAVKKIVPGGAAVIAPGGFGVHVDHLATRAVGTSLSARIFYYEDLPYAAKDVRLSNALDFFKSQNLRRRALKTTPELIDKHLGLYNLYASQRKDAHVGQIRAHLSRLGFGVWAAQAADTASAFSN